MFHRAGHGIARERLTPRQAASRNHLSWSLLDRPILEFPSACRPLSSDAGGSHDEANGSVDARCASRLDASPGRGNQSSSCSAGALLTWSREVIRIPRYCRRALGFHTSGDRLGGTVVHNLHGRRSDHDRSLHPRSVTSPVGFPTPGTLRVPCEFRREPELIRVWGSDPSPEGSPTPLVEAPIGRSHSFRESPTSGASQRAPSPVGLT